MKDIIGHEDIISSFYNAINLKTISHAHIFWGEDGIGKSIVAKNIAIKLIGKNENRDYVDIVEFKLKAGRLSIGVNEIRGLIEEINKKPYESDKKVVIIHNGDKMTIQAQNALLKTIEEPPKNIFIIILCEELNNILETIKSRCQIHKFIPLKDKELLQYLQNYYSGLKDENENFLLEFSRGIPGRVDMLLNDDEFNEIRDKAINIVNTLGDLNIEDTFTLEEFFINNAKKFEYIVDIMISFLRDAIIYKEIGNKDLIINKDKFEEIKMCASMFSFKQLNDIISIINATRVNLDKNVNNALAFNVMLLKLQEV